MSKQIWEPEEGDAVVITPEGCYASVENVETAMYCGDGEWDVLVRWLDGETVKHRRVFINSDRWGHWTEQVDI